MLRFITGRLQTKLILAFVLVLLVPTGIIAGYTANSTYRQLTTTAQQDELKNNQLEGNQIVSFLARTKSDLEFLRQDDSLQKFADSIAANDQQGAAQSLAAVQKVFVAFAQSVPIYDKLRLLDNNGREILRVNNVDGITIVTDTKDLQDKSDRPYYKETIQLGRGNTYISPLNLDQENGQIAVPHKPVLRYATPVVAKNGQTVGVLVTTVLAENFLSLVHGDNSTEQAFLIDADGTYLAGPDAAQLFGADLKTGANFLKDHPNDGPKFLAAEQGSAFGSQDAPDRLQIYTIISPADQPAIRWMLYHTQPTSTILNAIGQQQLGTLVLAVMALLVAVLIAFIFTRGIVQPVQQLAVAAEQLSRGKWDASIPVVKSGDEIADLASTFVTMSKELRTVYNSLETRVQERTAELQTVAEVGAATATILGLSDLLQKVSDLTKSSFKLYHAHVYLLDEQGENLVLAAGAGEAGRMMRSEGRRIALNNMSSLVARAGRDRAGVIANDVTEAPDFLPNRYLPDTQSEMAIPMIVGANLVGVLDVQSDQVNRFTETDVRVQTTLASQVAVAVENARAFTRINEAQDRTAKRAIELETVAKVSAAAATILNVDELLQSVTSLTKASFGLYHAHIYLLDDSERNLVLAAGAGEVGRLMKAEGRRIRVDNEHSLVARAGRTHEGIIVNDVTEAPDFLPNPHLPNTRSEMAIPMIVGENLVGILDVQSDKLNRFTDEDVRVMTTLSSQVAVAVQNARAYTETQAALNQTETLYNATDQLMRATTTADVLNKLVELSALQNMSRASLGIFDSPWKDIVPEGLVLAATWGQTAADAARAGVHLPMTRFPFIKFLEREKATIISDFNADPRVGEGEREYFVQTLKMQSVVIFPLTIGDEWIGFVSGQSHDQLNLTPLDIRQLEAMVSQAAAIVQNIRLLDATGAALRHNQLLAEINAELSQAPTEDDVLAVIGKVTESAGVKRTVLIYAETMESNRPSALRLVSGRSGDGQIVPPSAFATRILTNSDFPILETIYDNPGEVTFIEDLLTDPRCERGNIRAYATQSGIAGVILLPLKYGDQWLGAISASWEQPQHFTEDMRNLFTAMLPTLTSVVASRRAYLQEGIARRETEARALEMETVAAVSTAAATILDVDELLQSVVDLTKESFNLYHAHIYLLDDSGNYLVLTAGAGEVGRDMHAQGRRIAVNNFASLVARAARSAEGVIVNDVMDAADFLPNPLLPETRSEMAIPMMVNNKVIGVLDVQSEKINRFTEDDIRVKTTLAEQVAVAVENARLYQGQVQAAEQLRELDRLKSEFLANMSHELRTPLNSIIGYAEVMIDGIDGELPAEAIEDVQAIYGSGQHLLSMINDILDLAKIEAGRMELDLEAVKLQEVADEVHSITNILLKEKAVELVMDIDPDLPDVWGDQVRLRQILNNLVSNASKFTNEGEIRVRATFTDQYRTDDGSGMVLVEVKDTGEGISEDHLDLVFQQFRQVDSSSTRRAGGTGMGLAITRHLIELHGGTIWVTSTLGQGSTFAFTVPAAQVTVAGD